MSTLKPEGWSTQNSGEAAYFECVLVAARAPELRDCVTELRLRHGAVLPGPSLDNGRGAARRSEPEEVPRKGAVLAGTGCRRRRGAGGGGKGFRVCAGGEEEDADDAAAARSRRGHSYGPVRGLPCVRVEVGRRCFKAVEDPVDYL